MEWDLNVLTTGVDIVAFLLKNVADGEIDSLLHAPTLSEVLHAFAVGRHTLRSGGEYCRQGIGRDVLAENCRKDNNANERLHRRRSDDAERREMKKRSGNSDGYAFPFRCVG
jgi:hypothetical protein